MAHDERQSSTIDDHLRFPWREQHLENGRRCCAWPGCEHAGEFKAPKSRSELRDFIWFCLDHVREYNKTWNYFLGMSQDEIDAHRRDDVTWHRPTWGFGSRTHSCANDGSRSWRGFETKWSDPFGFMGGEEPPQRAAPKEEDKPGQMRRLLELEENFTQKELKQAYKVMVKRYHPDLHGGDKAAEERLKLIIEAYRYLKDNELYLGA